MNAKFIQADVRKNSMWDYIYKVDADVGCRGMCDVIEEPY
jgi:hypothetical protein